MLERLVKAAKEEEVCINGYLGPLDAKRKLVKRCHIYNHERRYQGLECEMALEAYTGENRPFRVYFSLGIKSRIQKS